MLEQFIPFNPRLFSTITSTTYLQDRFGSVLRSKSPPKTFKDFINAEFAKINPKVLQKCKVLVQMVIFLSVYGKWNSIIDLQC